MTAATAATTLPKRDPYPHPDDPSIICNPVIRSGKPGLVAMIDRDDFTRLIQEYGLSPFWHVRPDGKVYGRAKYKGQPGKRYVIAHLVTGTAKCGTHVANEAALKPRGDHCIGYRDRNPLNLRRENLVASPRKGGGEGK